MYSEVFYCEMMSRNFTVDVYLANMLHLVKVLKCYALHDAFHVYTFT